MAQAAPPASPPPTRVIDTTAVDHGPTSLLHNGEPRIGAYLAKPKGPGPFRAVIVATGNKLSEEYIPNTCVALALAGFVAIAPDVFHALPDLSKHTDEDSLDDLQQAASFLRQQAYVAPGGFGMVGFCVGGKLALFFASRSRDIDAVVAYHPGIFPPARIDRMTQPVLIHHGTADTGVPYENSVRLADHLRARGNPVDLQLYPGANHGFLAYTRVYYRPDDAVKSWTRTIAFLDRNVKATTP
jgi:carboxymethylenebutenolidase